MDYYHLYIKYKSKYTNLKKSMVLRGGKRKMNRVEGNKLCIIQYNRYNLVSRDKFPQIFLLDKLTKKIEELGYDVILLKEDFPNEVKKINRDRKIDVILDFSEIYARFAKETRKEMNLEETIKLYIDCEKNGTKIYPPTKSHNLIVSKKYMLALNNENKIILPHGKAYLLKPENDNSSSSIHNNVIWDEISDHLYGLKNMFDYSIIKVGYSGELVDIFFVNNNDKEIGKDEIIYRFPSDQIISLKELEKVKNLYNKYVEEEGVELVVIIQPFNEIVADRHNEYRLWYLDGKFVGYFCHGIIKDKETGSIKKIDNIKYDKNDQIHKSLVELGDYVYKFINKEMKKELNDDNFELLATRIDLSYAVDDKYFDEHVMEIENKKYRFYCNEIENLSGTYYLNIPIIDKKTGKKYDTREFQNKLVDILINKIFH